MTENTYIRNPHLPGDEFFWEGNSTGVLLIHGFTATTAEVRLLAEKLHTAGYTTAAPLLPGHGTHPDDLNRANWAMWVEKVKQSYQKLNRQCHRVFVGGVSMGSLLALELARQHPEIDGLFLFVPAIKVSGLWRARILWPFFKYFNKSGKDDGLPWKGYNVNPVKAGAELHKLQVHVRQNLSSITQPVVVFTGELDHTIAPDSAQIILEGVQSTVKHHFHMKKSSHGILIGCDLDQITKHVLRFIEDL
jgi:carboxylesterase